MENKNNFWNIRYLEPPPTSTYRADNYKIDVKHLYDTTHEAKQFFKEQHHLQVEAALLSRCIYRMKMKFRSEKGFKAMEKINQSLLRYLQIDFTSILDNLCDVIPNNYENVTYFPTKNMIDYVLIRLQGLSKIMCRVVETSKIATIWMEKKINLGHFWQVAIIAIALVSRIWVLSRNIVKFCCKFYIDLLPYSNLLQNTAQAWLSSEYNFPNSLKEWLNVEWIDNEEVMKLPDLNEENKVECIEIDDEEKINQVESTNVFKGFEMSEVGEVVERAYESNTENKVKKKKRNKSGIDILTKNTSNLDGNIVDKLNTIQDLKKFIISEEQLRQKNVKKCTLKHIDKLQWNILYKKVMKLIKICEHNQTDKVKYKSIFKKAKSIINLNIK